MDYSKSFKKESPFLNVIGMGGGVSSLLTLASGVETYLDDVFSTQLYTATGNNITITNGIDLAGEGGLIWTKWRAGGAYSTQSHALLDTDRGFTKLLKSNSDGKQSNVTSYFTAASDGYEITSSSSLINQTAGGEYCSWTFRKAPGFFDIVQFDGDGTNRSIAHNLGSKPGVFIVKSTTENPSNWGVYHHSLGATKYLTLDTSNAANTSQNLWNNTEPTATHFTVHADQNKSGQSYVAYLFAHNDGSFGEDADEAVIKCGTYTGTGSAGNKIDLGFEPQFLIIKNTSTSTGRWFIVDTMRGMADCTGGTAYMAANQDAAEANTTGFAPEPDGFQVNSTGAESNTNGYVYAYIAIRRPHKPPTTGTDVLDILERTGTGASVTVSSDVTVDLAMVKHRTATNAMAFLSRLMGNEGLRPDSNAAENNNVLGSTNAFDVQKGINFTSDGDTNSSSSTYINYFFKRSPGVFDAVIYDGSSSAQNIPHSLGVKPALIICKRRNSTGNWQVYADVTDGGATKYLMLDDTGVFATNTNRWNDTEPTDTQFTVGTYSDLNTNGGTYIAYLFANKDGICKIGQYTGTGSDITIDCGFDPRFIVIKVITSSGDGWYIFDSESGINSGNDPWIRFNQTNAEITNTDIVDPITNGFVVQAGAGSRANDSDGRKYLFWAMA